MPEDNYRFREQQAENLRTAYRELCTSYHAIDDFRAKLLGFLPLATGTGILLLLDKLNGSTDTNISSNVVHNATTAAYHDLLAATGIFGFLIALGLYFYEIHGTKKCCALQLSGKQMESSLGIYNGQFTKRPQNVLKVINEPFAAGVIYSAVLSSWMFIFLEFNYPKSDPFIPIVFFMIVVLLALLNDIILRKRLKSQTNAD